MLPGRRRSRGALVRGSGIALVAALTACATLPTVVGLEYDPGFTYEALRAAPLAVLSVTWESLEPTSTSASLQLSGLLGERLARKRPDLRIVPAAQVADSLGLEDYSTLVRRQQARGRLDGRGLSRLAAALGGVRYLVVARLGADELESGVSVEEKLALEIRDV